MSNFKDFAKTVAVDPLDIVLVNCDAPPFADDSGFVPAEDAADAHNRLEHLQVQVLTIAQKLAIICEELAATVGK